MEDSRMHSVMTRDARADGTFVYAVRTTGIYCRPSCPSRRPRPESIEFYPAPAAAESAGYRACKRCAPQGVSRQRFAMLAICKYLSAHAEERLTLSTLSRRVGLSPCHLQRLFKKTIGVSPREYQESQRMLRFRNDVRRGRAIADAMLDSGFGSSSRLYEKSGQLGMTPSRYRRKGAGLNITYTVFDSPLGAVLVAATSRGVCKISLGDRAEDLERELHTEFAAATVTRDAAALRVYIETILRYLEDSREPLELPLDIRATAFQRRVWNIVKAIAPGTTRSYEAVARRTGKPTAVRAVARAIATNPLALVVPCHRVLRKNGELAGYRWGIERKKTLLEWESNTASRKKAPGLKA